MGKDGVFGLLFALAVVVVQGGLDAAGHQDRGFVAALGQQMQQGIGQPGIAAVELTGVLGAVDARQMYHKGSPAAVVGQGLHGIVLFKQQKVSAAQGMQGGHQVAAHKTAGAGDQNGMGQGRGFIGHL